MVGDIPDNFSTQQRDPCALHCYKMYFIKQCLHYRLRILLDIFILVGLGLWCLTPLSTKFHFYWWMKPEKNTDLSQFIDKHVVG